MLRLIAFCFLAVVFVGTEGHFRRVCENQVMTINCGSRFIDIHGASYGRTQKGLCGNGKDTNCHAGVSMNVVRYECQGQHHCTLYAKNSVFGDPCRGTKKYLQVKYNCMPRSCTGLLLRICEGGSQAIQCHGSKKINILTANYGRLTGKDICPGPVKTTNCGAARSLTKVRAKCQGRGNCTLYANNGVFGDPCKGTKKYLEIRYKCE